MFVLFLQVCANGHIVRKWCSQSILNQRMHGGDLMFASPILLSGSNFKKILMLAEPTHRDYFPLSSVLLHHTFSVRLQVKVFESKMIHQTFIDFH